jgi:ribosomal protein S18 acetylase RimI-like enzyme
VHPAVLEATARRLEGRGVRRILTPALRPEEQVPFLELGYRVRERLHLLRHDLHDLPVPPTVALRRGWRGDYAAALEIDALAFSAFWRFDRAALVDARTATPASTFRVAERRRPCAYAVTGVAGDLAYLQRLAVHPDHQHRGVGTALVVDALRWARRRRARAVLVNTQEANATALGLYRHLGFVPEPHGLAVLEQDLHPSGAPA